MAGLQENHPNHFTLLQKQHKNPKTKDLFGLIISNKIVGMNNPVKTEPEEVLRGHNIISVVSSTLHYRRCRCQPIKGGKPVEDKFSATL